MPTGDQSGVLQEDPRDEARRGTAREPHNAIAWILLAEAELDAGDARAGQSAAGHALRLAPGHPEALARLGRAYWMQGNMQGAADSLREAARRAPQHPGIAVWLGHVLEDVDDAEGANDAYGRAHRIAPQDPRIADYLLAWRRRLCDWRDLDVLSQQVRGAVRDGSASMEPFAFLSEDATPAEQLRCAQQRAAQIAEWVRPMRRVAVQAHPEFRIGFLSNGFGAHPTGLLIVAMLEALRAEHDVSTHLFALSADDGSDIRRRLAEAAHALHDVSQEPHTSIAESIQNAGIDVLFDLRGWGGGGTPEVLAMRPAVLQVNWLAYPGTSGAPWMDYVLADRFVLPDALIPHFSEHVLRLPRCFQPSDTTREIPAPATRTEYGLPEHGVVFACFNNTYKLNPSSFARMMSVLRDVPDSVLWLLSGPGQSDQRMDTAAATAGIDPARVVFMVKQPQPEYLARLQQVDLFLDTHPYNAHTTASDALWAGCPVLTCPGAPFAARVAGSLNHHLGLEEMNVTDDARFIERAVALGRDPASLQDLRARLRRARTHSGLFDTSAFAADFARMVRHIVGRQRQGLSPAHHDALR